MPFYKIAETIAAIVFQDNDMCSVVINGKEITLAKKDNQLFGFAAHCPHAGFPLKEGYINAKGCLVCPKHDYQFNMQQGRCVNVEDYRLKMYKTQHREDGWYIEV